MRWRPARRGDTPGQLVPGEGDVPMPNPHAPVRASGGGWCAPSEMIYLPDPPPVTWLVDAGELAAMTEADRVWLDQHWALSEDRA